MKEKLILLVEDSKKVQNYNRRMLEDEGFAVETIFTLGGTRAFLALQKPEIIVLDIGMPDGNGLDFLREFRETSKIPVLMLTGYGADKDIVLGFNAGCDDYLTKPYTFNVLLARLNCLLKSAEQVPEAITRGLLTLKLTPRGAYVNGVDLLLTPKDFSLLQFFIQNDNQVMNAEYIYINVWGQPMAGDSRALGKGIQRLRKKLAGCGYTITANYGSGYIFEQGEP